VFAGVRRWIPGDHIVTQPFSDDLAHFAMGVDGPHLLPIIAGLRAPLRVAVVGRDGVGRGCVETALRRRGVAVVPRRPHGAVFDVGVLVIAEAAKPEDVVAARSTSAPVLVVLTKADLAGAGAGGPLAAARLLAAASQRETGLPTVPVVGLLAALEGGTHSGTHPEPNLEDDLVAGLRAFVTEPPDLSTVDDFVGGPHGVAGDVRRRLLARLDRFGVAHAVLALAGGCPPDRLPKVLRGLGNLDEVMAALHDRAAQVRYRRLRTALAEVRALAVARENDALAGLLTSDVAAMAAMSAAVDVVEADGVSVDRGDTVSAHRRRAIRWRAYGRGPVNALHRDCSADIVRGSLRLMDGAVTGPA
jgi:hypothetical protein